MNLLLYSVLMILLGCVPLAEAATPPAAPSAARQLEDQGLEYFYSLEYDRAIATFQKLREAEPANATWQNHLAAAYLYKQLLTAGLLQGDLFASSNRIFSTRKVNADPALRQGFWEANAAASRLCEDRLKENDKDEQALYACGVAYASRASYLGLIERAKLETLSSARKAASYHTQLTRLNPNRFDAYLVPGIYEFVLGSLPPSLRFLLFLGGFSGDKQKGMRAVETAAARAELARHDAKIILAVLYRREKRYADAQHALSELAESFPRNYIFPLEIASLYRGSGKEQEAILAYERVLDGIREGKPGYSEAPVARIHYELADLYRKARNLDAARLHLDRVAGSQGSSPELERQSAEMRRQIKEELQQPANQKAPSDSTAARPGIE